MNVNKGDKYSRHSYGTIMGTPHRLGMVRLRNEQGLEWEIGRAIFDAEFTLASPFESEEEVNQTQLIHVIKENQRIAMTVNFNKQVNDDTVTDEITALLKAGKVPTKRTLKKKVKEMLCGEDRTLVGRHTGSEDDRGRMKFLDMDKGPRLVDPRAVNWAIISGVKYVKKQ